MTTVNMLIILSIVYTAPHLTPQWARALSITCLVVAALFAIFGN